MINVISLGALICSLHNVIPSGSTTYNKYDCEERAQEYIEAAKTYDLDPLELLAIDIHECNLRTDISLKYFKYKKNKNGRVVKQMTSIDLCPMGLRITKLNKNKYILKRKAIVDRSAKLLAQYKSYHNKQSSNKKKSHHYFGHYNWGYKIYNNGKHARYDDKVLNIYKQLKGEKPEPKDTRIISLINRIKRAQEECKK